MDFDAAAFDVVMSQVTDGGMFERFAQDFLGQVLGLSFQPIGRVHDKGIDGLEHVFTADGIRRTIYQMSVEADPRAKIRKTLGTLSANAIECARFFYVTNHNVENQHLLVEEMYEDFGVTLMPWDLAWLRGRVNQNEGTLRTYLTFLESYHHTFGSKGAIEVLADLDTDPRLFVFLRQQWETAVGGARLDQLLVDSLVLFSLEGTDPDLGLFRSKAEILAILSEATGFGPWLVRERIDERLNALSMKPRRINYHSDKQAYCLPYQTRVELQEKKALDVAVHEAFRKGAEKRIRALLREEGVMVKDAIDLMLATFNKLFKQQGLEFAEFVTKGQNALAVEKSLADVISEVVESSAVIPKNRPTVKVVLLTAIRELIYRGSTEEVAFLRRLANTYLMLFLLRCDPKIATYFSALASKLAVVVDNSILVPALSELPLAPEHRRHWNLLTAARRAGVRLLVSESAVAELAAHVRKAVQDYETYYAGREDLLTDEPSILYIDEILIRSYFYSRLNGKDWTFRAFLDQFVSADSTRMERELAVWLNGTFGLEVLQQEARIDETHFQQLRDELRRTKASHHQADGDARTILTVYALRKQNKEKAEQGIFGFRTWWLSKDTMTQKALQKVHGKKYAPSCYMRPDFLQNYIALAPGFDEVNQVFDRMFPSLLGVTISHHMPPAVTEAVQKAMRDHAGHSPARVKAVISVLSEELRTHGSSNTASLRHFLDEVKDLAKAQARHSDTTAGG